MKNASILQTVAFIPLGLAAAIFLAIAVRESSVGDWNGYTLFMPAVTMVLLLIFGWKQPFWSGVLMLVVAAFEGYRIFTGAYPPANVPSRLMLMVTPFAVSGVLEIIAAGLMPRELPRRRAFVAALSHRH